MRNWQRENIPNSQLITIRQRAGGVNDADVQNQSQLKVSAPLPDGFGMTVGSEFGTPFDTGSVNDILSKLFAVGGISQKAGIRMKKMYMNPEPTEISFDMEFYAWYDAGSEVVAPAVTLMCMALGRTLTYEELDQKIRLFYAKMAALANQGIDIATRELIDSDIEVPEVIEGELDERAAVATERLLELIGLVQGPPTCEIRFGNVITLPRCYITSVASRFSNVLDSKGNPMSATCSVTATLEQAPVTDDMLEYFGREGMI